MSEEYFTEKRESIRFYLAIPVQCLDNNSRSVYAAESHDISDSGMSLIIKKELPEHSSLDIRIKVPDNEEEVYTKGRVVWSRMIYSNQWRIGLRLAREAIKPIPIVLKVIQAKIKYHHDKCCGIVGRRP